MEILKCGLHVFAVALLAATTMIYASDAVYSRNNNLSTEPWGSSNTLVSSTHRSTVKRPIQSSTTKRFELQTATSNPSGVKISIEDQKKLTPSLTVKKGSTPTKHSIKKSTHADVDIYDDSEPDDSRILIATPENAEDDPFATETIPFRKCCAKGQSFSSGLKCVKRKRSLKGVDVAEDDLVGRKYPWFPTFILSNSDVVQLATTNILNVSRIKVQYASMPNCDETESLILQWYKTEQPFFFIFASNGTIAEVNHRSMETIAMWPVEAYCMDSVPSNEYSYYVVLLCPCLHKTCVRKCCPRGFYYNTTFNACNEFTNLTRDYRPTFYKGLMPLRESVSNYVLRRMPVCEGKKIETLYSPQDSLFIQKNGSLLMQQENGVWDLINNSRYCADYFVEDFLKEKVMNVLFCIKKSDRYFQSLFQVERIYRRSGEDFFSVNFVLFLAVLAFVVIYE